MAHIMADYDVNANEPLPTDYLDPIKQLWQDDAVRRTIAKGNEFALHDNLE